VFEFVIKKSRLRWFGHVGHKGNTDWIKCCVTNRMRPGTSEADLVGYCRRLGGILSQMI